MKNFKAYGQAAVGKSVVQIGRDPWHSGTDNEINIAISINGGKGNTIVTGDIDTVRAIKRAAELALNNLPEGAINNG